MKRTPIKRKNAARAKKRQAENFGLQADLCRHLPCVGCGANLVACDPAHHPSRNAGGDDGDCVPLCRSGRRSFGGVVEDREGCHAKQHRMGVIAFQEDAQTDMQLVATALRAICAPMANGEPLRMPELIAMAEPVIAALCGIGVDPRTGGHAPVRAPRPKVPRGR